MKNDIILAGVGGQGILSIATILGAASLFIDLSPDSIEEAIAAVFATKGDRIIENNINAFRAGRKEAEAMRK